MATSTRSPVSFSPPKPCCSRLPTTTLACTPRQFPADCLTLDLLISRNDFGDTPLHAAAVEGHLKDVPREFINHATLSIRNYTGGTPIGAAIHNGHADQLPEEFRPKPPTIVQKILYRTGFSRPP